MPSVYTPEIALLCCRTLNSARLLKQLKHSNWFTPQEVQELRQQLYLDNQPWHARLPDHVFDLGFQAAQAKGLQDGQLASSALRLLAERYLIVQQGEVHVQLNLFGEWQQSVLSRVSGIPVLAAMQALQLQRGGHLAAEHLILQKLPGNLRPLPLPCIAPRDGAVEDYITREGLHESHLHLNGSSFTEQCWLRALARPDQETKQFSALWKETKHSSASYRVRELARMHDSDFSPKQLRDDLTLARLLRDFLLNLAQQPLLPHTGFPKSADELRNPADPALALKLAKASHRQHRAHVPPLIEELKWLTQLLSQPSLPRQVDRMLHCYLLLQNQYRALMVQSEELYGFDQFQKFTHTELRSLAEKRYLQRLRDIHGPHAQQSQSCYLEGRFAPKSSTADNRQLLKIILLDYLEYLQEGNNCKLDVNKTSLSNVLEVLDTVSKKAFVRWPFRQQLALVAHFIKEDWDFNKGGPYRHYLLRRKLENQMAQLRTTLNDHPRLHRWLRGVDGAANELHAPPEVFSSIFRQATRAGLGHRSFHVGEDFPHLLTGIRHMLDALELLDLRNGDRMGHGTALGIAPKLWLQRMPSTLYLKRGDRLLDLLAAWKLLREQDDTIKQAYQVEVKINSLLAQVFKVAISAHLFERAMRLRDLHMGFVAALQSDPDWNWRNASLVDSLREEARLVSEANEQDAEAMSLMWQWQSDRELWNRSESLISTEAQDTLFTPAAYLSLQQALMKHVANRGVVIEILPSSNVRISQYERFEEHHALRWMGIPGYVQDGDTPIMVCLGSDDPGIFAGNLKGEFYQLYAALKQRGVADSEALRQVSTVNERGRQYRFHDPSL